MEGITTGYHAISQIDVGSSTSSNRTFLPQVRPEVIPRIGQQFDSLDDAQHFYNEYAREAGFSIRAWTTKKNKSNEITRREFVCYKQGIRQVENPNYVPRRKRGLTREGCEARIAFVKSDANQKFVVSTFHEVHNHNLTTPRKVHLVNEEAYKVAFETLDSLKCKLSTMTLDCGVQSSMPSVGLSQPLYNDPEKVRAKGCGKRLKGGKELAKKVRRCHGCGLTGQAHDKRNCPMLNNVDDTTV